MPSTEFAISHNHFNGSLHCAICLEVALYVVPMSFRVLVLFRIPCFADMIYCGLYISTHDNIASCMMLLDADLVVHLAGEELLSLSWEM